jgi:hypothetical protein
MAITTAREFIDNLEAITITGVIRQFRQGPPTSVQDADIPATFVKLPSVDEGPMVFQNQGGWPRFRATLVVLVEAEAQNIQPENFDAVVDMMDAVSAAFRSESCGNLAKSHINWSMRQGIETVAGYEYWALFVDVDAQG